MNAAKCIAALAAFCFCTAELHTAGAETPADGQVLVYHELAQKAADREPRPREAIFLPTGDLFKPLLADPKEPRFYLSYRLFKVQSSKIHGAAGGYGEIFGLYRRPANDNGYSWQASFGGGIHSQFDLHSSSLDLVNTDYIIGFPFTLRKGQASYRITIFHKVPTWATNSCCTMLSSASSCHTKQSTRSVLTSGGTGASITAAAT